ncbi:unnamed protein product [Heterobilharzia americana]|nr:unnamed protein product [Heterobilharzia americana]
MLNRKIKQTQDGRLEISAYRKPTHSNRYLVFKSSHLISVKVGLVKSLSDREKQLTSGLGNLRQEIRHIKNTLHLNNYPLKFINKFIGNQNKNISSSNTGVIDNNSPTNGNNGDRVEREF